MYEKFYINFLTKEIIIQKNDGLEKRFSFSKIIRMKLENNLTVFWEKIALERYVKPTSNKLSKHYMKNWCFGSENTAMEMLMVCIAKAEIRKD